MDVGRWAFGVGHAEMGGATPRVYARSRLRSKGKEFGAMDEELSSKLSPQEAMTRSLERDLHKGTPPGELVGEDVHQSEYMGLDADSIKDLRGRLPGLTDAELRQLPVEPEGYQLRQGATYVDLRDPDLKPFTAMGGMTARRGQALVPKSDTDYLLWNRIVGVRNPEQLDEPPDATMP